MKDRRAGVVVVIVAVALAVSACGRGSSSVSEASSTTISTTTTTTRAVQLETTSATADTTAAVCASLGEFAREITGPWSVRAKALYDEWQAALRSDPNAALDGATAPSQLQSVQQLASIPDTLQSACTTGPDAQRLDRCTRFAWQQAAPQVHSSINLAEATATQMRQTMASVSFAGSDALNAGQALSGYLVAVSGGGSILVGCAAAAAGLTP